MTPLYEPVCERCNDDGIERLATETRFGEPLCVAHATEYDDREPPESDLSGPTLRERQSHEAETYHRERFK